MVGKTKKPKELLSDHELIGFTRRASGGDQAVHRASSAKILEPSFLSELAKGVSPATPADKSDS